MNTGEKKMTGIQSVDRAFLILETVTTARQGCSLKYLADTLHLNKTTIYRLLHAMMSRGFIRQSGDLYYSGFKILELSSYIRDGFELIEVSKPFLTQLSITTNLAVHLSVFNGLSVVYIHKIENPSHIIRMYSDVGKTIPAYCSSSGKAILAWQEQEAIEYYLSQVSFLPFTSETITEKDALIAQLEDARKKGYAYDWFEHERSISCIASPIINDMGNVIASISIAGTVDSIPPSSFAAFAENVNQTARAISTQIGCLNYPAVFQEKYAKKDAVKYENTIRQLFINCL